MAFELIHSFTDSSTGAFWEMYYDRSNGYIQTNKDGSVVYEPGTTASHQDYIAPEGHVFLWHCDDSTKVSVKAIHTWPFLEIQRDINSPSCSTTPPNCLIHIDTVDVTNETFIGSHDGTATINVDGFNGTNLMYSLDGFNWQTSNVFTGLHKGNYVAYAKGDPNCKTMKKFIVLDSGAAIEEVEYPWQEPLCHFFKLKIPGQTPEEFNIREPGKWDNVNFIGKRDKTWHGYRGMWSDGIIQLQFDCDSGKDEIKEEYDLHGSDGEVYFIFGYTYKGTDYTLFDGKLDMNTYKEHPGYIECSVEKNDFDELLQARIETKVSMTEETGYDGATIPAPPVSEISLHSKEIIKQLSIAQNSGEESEPTQFILGGSTNMLYPQFNTADTVLAEIEEYWGQPASVGLTDHVTDKKYILDIKEKGTVNINISFDTDLSIKMTSRVTGAVKDNAYTLKTYLQINDTKYSLHPTLNFSTGTNSAYRNYTGSVNMTADLEIGDKVYLYSEVQFNTLTDSYNVYSKIKTNSLNVSFDYLSATAETEMKGWMIFDVINHCIKTITNNTSFLMSSFFGLKGSQQSADGPGSLNITTNGKQIRRFAVDENPLKVSLKDMLDSARAMWCIGYGVERYGNYDVARVERADYFYRDKEILRIEECSEYRLEVAKDMLYNEIEIGYSKFKDSGFNTLDEFNTKREYLTPIKTNKLKLSLLSKLITSGYSIEDSRRQQFTQTSTNSYSNDDDPFLIAVKKGTGVYLTEKDESFQKVENLISPSTAYNLRHTPFRMLLNWATWLKGVFHYKESTDIIKNTFVAQNGDLITQFKSTEPNPVGDINLLEWQEKQDVSMANYEAERGIWRPEYIKFKTRLTPDKINMIHKCMTGVYHQNKNYGYITVKDAEGLYQAGWLMELEYNFYTEVASFVLLMKSDSPNQPQDCCDDLVVNDCYLLVNGQRLRI